MKKVSTFSYFKFSLNAAKRILQIFLFVSPIFYFSITTYSSFDQPLDQVPNDQVLYISSGTMLVGGENIHNAKVVMIASDTSEEADHLVTERGSASKKSLISSKKEKQASTVKIENKIAVVKVNVKFFSFPRGNSDIRQRSDGSIIAIFTPSNSLKKFSATFKFVKLILGNNCQLKTQKFFTSIFNLQFAKYSNSYLRGPPILS